VADTEGLKVAISYTIDTSGLAAAKAQFQSFTQGATQTIGQTTAAMNQAGAAADNLAGKTQNLGTQIGQTGSRRELSESLRLMKAGAEGTNGAFDALRAVMLTFGTALGGPVLIGIAAAMAVLGTLYEMISKSNDAAKQLNDTAAALNLPVDQVKNMSAAALDLAMQIAAANAGIKQLGQAQTNILTAMGLDPTSTASAEKALSTIAQSALTVPEKIKQISIAFGGISYDDAQKKLDDYTKTSEQSVLSWWQRLGAILANNEGDISNDDLKDALQSKGDVDKKNNTGKTASTPQTQAQLDAAQTLQDQLTAIINKGIAARIAGYASESDRIIAESNQEVAALLANAAKEAAANPGGAKTITDTANNTADAMRAEAQKKAQQARLQAVQQFNQELAQFYQADAAAQISAQTDATAKLTDQANIEINAKADALAKDLQNVQLSNAQKQQLEDAYVKYVTDRESQLATDIAAIQQEQLLKTTAYYNNANKAEEALAKEGSDALKDVGEDTQTQLANQLQERLDKAAELYQTDVDNAKKALDQKLIDQQAYETQVLQFAADYNTSVAKIYQANTLDQYKQTNTQLNNWNDMTKQMDQFWSTTMNDSATQLANFVATGKFSFESFTQSILTDLAKIAIQKSIAGIFGSLFNGGGGSGDVLMEVQPAGSLMGGFAGGGTVQPGVPIMTGERGPEPFIPNVGGQIVNNSAATAGGSGSITVNINNQGTAQKVQSATPTQTIDGMVIDIITTDIQRGGKTAQTLGSAFNLKKGG
jgi:lambda family phage tail tape measure protein